MYLKFQLAILLIFVIGFSACGQSNKNKKTSTKKENNKMTTDSKNLDIATFGGGCFWCTEAIFQELKGVQSVTSGYSGGAKPNPTYEQVCSGATGHAECTQIVYDATAITYDELLEVFWKTHDPTTLNQQGADHGTQYRSVIFYHNEKQKERAEYYKAELTKQAVYPNPIVTEITGFTHFYAAENYHQDYYNQNKSQGYCNFVITPKVEKFRKVFKDKLRKE
ncbi:MAG: peptide-methionine (S)-S-oxide reductase MsrA [Bacteroidetes bacterium]|nr:peptide-methionine (S)-S-oxide reductase MsrA [Bacteroidota bacterium]